MLLAGELVANSVRHSDSSLPGQTITVTVTAEADGLLVEVTDRSGPGLPTLRHDDDQAEGGRGLQLVNALAGRWGCRAAWSPHDDLVRTAGRERLARKSGLPM